ncbi:hypothetical protein [Tropicimonas sp.]|uniref:hypothetical protein n=1 Tax=Tropicimonas sp. TaxID=2067044 RepID=UPI003A84DDB7
MTRPAGRNRICEIDLIETAGGYLVNYRYGWEGSASGEGTRTPDPVERGKARYGGRQGDMPSAALLSRLEALPGLDDGAAGRLLWSLS